MSGSISGSHASSAATQAPKSSDTAKQQAVLNKLLQTYTQDLKNGQAPSQLTSLAKQITDAAKALGQNVTLPKPPASTASPAAVATADTNKLSVKA